MRLLFSLGLLLAVCPHAFAGDILTARFTKDLSVVNVELCFDGVAASRLYRNSQADNWSESIRHNDQPITIGENDGTVRLPSLPDNICLNWKVDITAAMASLGDRSAKKLGDDLIMNADIWFWQGPRNRNLSVRMLLPDGIAFSTPWKFSGRENGASIYQPDDTPPNWEARLALGRFQIRPVDVPGAQLRLAIPGNLTEPQQQTLTAWIQESAAAVSSVTGQFPQPNPQVLIIPAGNRGRADMFGQVLRGGGVSATFFINESRSLQEFRSGWTATHEFSHMLLPYISSRDRWLSEGLASYYQNVLRARDGRLSATQAWQELYDGFERGEQAATDGTLAQATRAGRASTLRVYWSGAAIMLMADIQLRQASGGQQSLDSTLTSLADCCLSNGATWQARDMFVKLDSLSGTGIFSALYQQYVNAEAFPNLEETFNALGIKVENGQVTLQPEAPLAAVRNAIMKD